MIPYGDLFITYSCIRPVKTIVMGVPVESNNYTADTISFLSNIISDSTSSLPILELGTYITVSGSLYNDGMYLITNSTTSALTVNINLVTETVGALITLSNEWTFTGMIQEINAYHKPVAETELTIGDYKLFCDVNEDIKINDRIYDGTEYYEVKNVCDKTYTRYMDEYKYCLLKKIGDIYA